MRRSQVFSIVAGFAVAAIAVSQGSVNLLASHVKGLSDAKSLTAKYTVQPIGGAARPISIEFQKPNRLRIETPEKLIVGDGKEIHTLDKSAATYYTISSTPADLAAVFSDEEVALWGAFFGVPQVQPAKARSLGTKTRKGQNLTAVEVIEDRAASKTVTVFMSPTDGIARAAQIDHKSAADNTTTVLDTKEFALGAEIAPSRFTFEAPSDARKVTLEELESGKWFTDLEQAKKLAKKLKRPIFVDFMADWCGPCKKLDAEVLTQERFKKLASKRLVLLKIDVDRQKSVASAYNIEAMPTQMLLDEDGKVLAVEVGYGNAEGFFSFLMSALRR